MIPIDLSLIIPVHSAQEKIDLLLDALCEICLDNINAEIFFVADRCRNRTIAKLNIWCRQKHNWAGAFCVEADVGSSDLARGIGLKHASGKFVAFLDDDCLPSVMWLARGLKLAKRYGAVTGKVQHGHSFLQNLCAVMDFGEFQSGAKGYKFNAPGCNLIFRADLPGVSGEYYPVLQGLNYGGDRILSFKLAHLLNGIYYDPELIVFHDPDLTLSLIWKREQRYGSVAWQVRKENSDVQWGCLLKTGIYAPFILASGRFLIDLKRSFQMKNCSLFMRAALGVALVPFRIAWLTGIFHCRTNSF